MIYQLQEEKEERKNRAKAEILEGKAIDFTDDVIDKLFDKCSCYNKIIDARVFIKGRKGTDEEIEKFIDDFNSRCNNV